MRINSALCFSPDDLRQYLATQQNMEDNTLNSEIIASLVLHELFSKVLVGWSEPIIYFEPKASAHADLAQKIGTKMPYSQVGTYLEEYVEQNSDFDFLLVSKDESPALVRPVQMKRFYVRDNNKPLEEFIEFLEKLQKQYAPSQASLAIYWQGASGLQFSQLKEFFKDVAFPFEEIIFITNNGLGEWNVTPFATRVFARKAVTYIIENDSVRGKKA